MARSYALSAADRGEGGGHPDRVRERVAADGPPDRADFVLLRLATIQELDGADGAAASRIADGLPWSSYEVVASLRELRAAGRVEQTELGERWRVA